MARAHISTSASSSRAGTVVSAFFILTANAWMQHPVIYRIVGNKAELTDFWAVLGNSTP
jgi:cytochrome d ubiquinol oxidase subunit I